MIANFPISHASGVLFHHKVNTKFDYQGVYNKIADGSRVIVEMQNYAKTTFVDRALVYTSASILENYSYSRSRDYQVQKTYLIAITGEKVFPEVDHAPVRLALCDIDSPERRVLNDKILQIFIELPKFANEIGDLNKDSSFLNKFAVAMKTMAGCDKRPELMDDAMLVGLFEAADLHRYKTKDLNSYKDSVMNEFEYEETLKEYREEGRAEGIAQTAKKLKEQGIPLETIALCTGLDVETIESL